MIVKVLKSKYFFWPLLVVSILISGIAGYFFSLKEFIVFPSLNNFTYETYTDEPVGGKSEVLGYMVSDSVIKIEFLLQKGFHSPYIGLSISPQKKQFIDIGHNNQICLKLKGENIERVGISFYTAFNRQDNNQSQNEELYHSYLNISEEIKTYNIPINQFKHPEWWEDLHHISKNKKYTVDRKRILHVNIGSAYSPDIDTKKTLKIYSISFSRDNQTVCIFLGILEMALLSILFSLNYINLLKKEKKSFITVFYKPLDISEKRTSEETFLEYINQHFSNCNLSLEMVSKKTSIPQRQIANFIKSKFNCNFKTYLNRIRINESKRLLEQTNLNIGEIAFKVGFNNQSHFNRVFKSEYQISPTEYRNKLKL